MKKNRLITLLQRKSCCNKRK